MRQHELQARAGILFLEVKILEAEGKAAEAKAEILAALALTFQYTIDTSEAELDHEVSEPFLPEARSKLNSVLEMQLQAVTESGQKYGEMKRILDRLQAENDSTDWPSLIH